MQISFRQSWEVLRRYLRPQRAKVLLLAVLVLGGIALQLLSPQIVSRFIDALTARTALDTLALLAWLYLGVALVQALVRLAATYFSEDVGWTATNAMRIDLAAHCLQLDMDFHNTQTPGALIERIDGDVGNLANFFSQIVLNVLGNVLLLIGTLFVLWLQDWRLGIAFSVFAVIVIALLGSMREIATPYLRAEREASADLFGFIEERLSGTEDIRANGAGAYTLRRLYEFMRRLFRVEFIGSLKIAQLRTTNFALFALGSVLSLVFGAHFFRTGEMTLGTVYLLYAYVQMLLRPMERLALDAQDFQKASASLIRVLDLYRTRRMIRDEGRSRLSDGAARVEFTDVAFAYTQATRDEGRKTNERVLHDISFRLEPGKVLGLLGRTGSGKTTITRLLLRLYEPASGAIRLDGIDVSDVALDDLRRSIGVVTQEVQLFNASVRDNLTFFNQHISDRTIIDVLTDLGLGDWLHALPEGLDTMLAWGGDLSAGQAQLLALARVFLRDPKLVILDEASSRLDPATERLIERAIDRLLSDRSAIIIAHRLSTIDRADDVLILSEGRIMEYGVRSLLVADHESILSGLLRQGLQEVLA